MELNLSSQVARGTLSCYFDEQTFEDKPEPPCVQLGPNTTRHLLFECKADVEVWKLLGIDEIIKKALLVDKAGEVNLEHLLCVPEQDVQVLAWATKVERNSGDTDDSLLLVV